MMYAQKFAVAIKVNGKVLRERGDQVALPFGSEYTITLKNLNSVRALVRIEIDGKSMTEGTSIIVPPNGSIDVERSIKGGNMSTGHKFKFIERTSAIEDHRGIEVEDGLVRIEYEFETERVAVPVQFPVLQPVWPAVRPIMYFTDQLYRDHFIGTHQVTCNDQKYSATSSTLRGLQASSGDTGSQLSAEGVSACAISEISPRSMQAEAQNVNGITVDGSVSDQKFTAGAWFPTDGIKHAIVIKLIGQLGDQPVTAPLTVKTKLECPTCGSKNSSRAKFCTECGTGLVIV